MRFKYLSIDGNVDDLANVDRLYSRKSRVEVENPHADSPGEMSEDNPLHGIQGLPDIAPTSPSQASVDVDHGQHMPHLLCAFLKAFKLPRYSLYWGASLHMKEPVSLTSP